MKTISYSEKEKGWKSFHSFEPDAMGNVGNKFFSVKNGQLYLHNETGPRNNFYGTQYTSKVSTVLNHDTASDKVFKTIFQEGNDAWDVTLETNLANGTLSKEEFNKRESVFHAAVKRNEDDSDLNGSAQGIGVIESINGNALTFSYPPGLISTGNKLFQINGSQQQELGTITSIIGNTVTILPSGTTPITGLFCYEKRNSRVDGGDIRGYYLKVDLENDNTNEVELFAVGSNAIKSHP